MYLRNSEPITFDIAMVGAVAALVGALQADSTSKEPLATPEFGEVRAGYGYLGHDLV